VISISTLAWNKSAANDIIKYLVIKKEDNND